MNTTYVFLCELGIHLNRVCNMSCYNFIIYTAVYAVHMQSRCTGRALVVQSVPGAHWGCAVNHRCITLNHIFNHILITMISFLETITARQFEKLIKLQGRCLQRCLPENMRVDKNEIYVTPHHQMRHKSEFQKLRLWHNVIEENSGFKMVKELRFYHNKKLNYD